MIRGSGERAQAEGGLGRAGGCDGNAEEREPKVFGMVTLPCVERRSQHRNAKEQDGHSQRRGDVLVPLAADVHRQLLGNIVVRAEFHLVDEASRDGERWTGPASNGDHGCALGIDAGETDCEGRGLVHRVRFGHAARVPRLRAIHEDIELSNSAAGDEQFQRRILGRRVELCKLLRAKTHAIPAVAGIGFNSLRGERVTQGDGLPTRVVESRFGPLQVISLLKAPGAIEIENGA